MAKIDEATKMQSFQGDLDISFSEVRAVLDHWGLRDWREYLVVRKAGCPESFIIFANPKDDSGFRDSQ